MHKIFISYKIEDSNEFMINSLAIRLEKNALVEKVTYWEGWDGFPNGDIVDFMEENITNSDVFIAICTPLSRDSKNCEQERKMAFYQSKRLIPIFSELKYVPETYKPYRGINITNKNLGQIIDELESLLRITEKNENSNIEQGSDEELEFSEKLIKYNGVKLVKSDAELLESMEKTIGMKIPVGIVDFNRFGFVPKLKRVFHLALNNEALDKEVPKEVFEFKALSMLYINNCNLDEIPKELGNLTELTELNLRYNNLKELPETIGKLKSLQILDVSNNNLRNLPEEFVNASKLTTLIISGNQIAVLPDEFGQMKSLEKLDATNNHLTFLPDSVVNASSLSKIIVPFNKITVLPEEIGKMKSLKELDARDNKISFLPDSIAELEDLVSNFWGNPVHVG